MKQWTGRVEEISSKDWHDIKLWSFRIEGEDRWFRTQKTPLDVEIGTEITFDERNSQVDLNSVVPTANAASDGSVSVSESGPTTSPSPAPTANAVGERIQWQAARRDACNVIVAALHTEALPWAKNTPKGKKLDLLRGYINELTKQFVEEENE